MQSKIKVKKRMIQRVLVKIKRRLAEYNLGSGMWSDDDMVYFLGTFVCFPLSMIKFFTMLVGFFKDFIKFTMLTSLSKTAKLMTPFVARVSPASASQSGAIRRFNLRKFKFFVSAPCK